ERSADQPPPRLRRSAVASAKAESLALHPGRSWGLSVEERSADQPPPRLRWSAVASAKAESLALHPGRRALHPRRRASLSGEPNVSAAAIIAPPSTAHVVPRFMR